MDSDPRMGCFVFLRLLPKMCAEEVREACLQNPQAIWGNGKNPTVVFRSRLDGCQAGGQDYADFSGGLSKGKRVGFLSSEPVPLAVEGSNVGVRSVFSTRSRGGEGQ